MLTPETLDRLEAQAREQQGREMGTGVFVMPGQLLALISSYRAAQAPAAEPAADA